jgi:hypothetical protein
VVGEIGEALVGGETYGEKKYAQMQDIYIE